jgi:hypothetical protein
VARLRIDARADSVDWRFARELKKPKDVRKRTARENRDRDTERKKIVKKIFEEESIGNPSRADVLKAILWEECRHQCPYTGIRVPRKTHAPLTLPGMLSTARLYDQSRVGAAIISAPYSESAPFTR